MDPLPPQPAELIALSDAEISELWRSGNCASVDLSKDELSRVLLALGVKYNYGLTAGATATREQIDAFWATLHLEELALAQACALGREAAWERFMTRYRQPLAQAAIGITRSPTSGEELADSLCSDLFGLSERDGERRSPLAYYSGRGSLMGFLRATLAQKNVDHHRRTSRETPLTVEDLAAAPVSGVPEYGVLSKLREALTALLVSLSAEEQFLLSAWFLDQRTMAEISRLLRVHEGTISRRIKRLTSALHEGLLRKLCASGMSRAQAEDALGTDPRDLDINLRTCCKLPGLSRSISREHPRTRSDHE